MLKRGVMLEKSSDCFTRTFFLFFNVPDRFSEETGTVAKGVNSSWVQFRFPVLNYLPVSLVIELAFLCPLVNYLLIS